MTAQYRLREDAAEFERQAEALTARIEDVEREIVNLRQKRDEARFHRAEALATADFLDNHGWKVERDAYGVVTVSVDPEKVPA